MTDLAMPPRARQSAPVDDLTARAWLSAGAAAEASGVDVRTIADLGGLTDVADLFGTIWGREQGPPMTPELLRAMSKAGSYIAGAFHQDRLIGAAVGFHEEPAVRTLHSHITGVLKGPWRSVGYALKLHQRAWALSKGIDEIAWTFDPLMSRNAYFNIVKLIARPVEYLPNFYGPMSDAINGNDETDRLLTIWRLRDDDVVAACDGGRPFSSGSAERTPDLAPESVHDLLTEVDGEPAVISAGDAHRTLRLAVPADMTSLRRTDSECAQRWRFAVRGVLEPLLADGARVIGFERTGAYLLSRPDQSAAAPKE